MPTRRDMLGAAAALPFLGATTSSPAAAAIRTGAMRFVTATPRAVGLAIGTLHRGERQTASFGRLRPGSTAQLTETTPFPIASISKTFTGLLLARAALAGRLSLDDDVRRHLPGDYSNLSFDGEPIRLWHLVNHNSGLPFNLPDLPGNRPPFPVASPAERRQIDTYTRADFLRDLHGVYLTRRPGTGFSYSNSAALLLSYILEQMAGEPFERLLRRQITGPLGMADTIIRLDPARARRLAPGFDENHAPAPPINDRLLGAASIKSTLADMLRYADAQLTERDPAIRLTHVPHGADRYALGLNWQMMTVGERRRIWQDGTAPGYASLCVLLPHARLAIVAFANELDRQSLPRFETMAQEIAMELDPGSRPLF